MHSAYQGPPPPPNPPTSPPRQSRVLSQRQYREREGECFNALRDVIKDLTGEELQTRQEILRKAIDLLSSILETRRQEQIQNPPSVPYDVVVPTNPADATSALLDYPINNGIQTWQPHTEFDEYGAYLTTQFNVHQCQMDPAFAFEQGNYGESWSGHPQL